MPSTFHRTRMAMRADFEVVEDEEDHLVPANGAVKHAHSRDKDVFGLSIGKIEGRCSAQHGPRACQRGELLRMRNGTRSGQTVKYEQSNIHRQSERYHSVWEVVCIVDICSESCDVV